MTHTAIKTTLITALAIGLITGAGAGISIAAPAQPAANVSVTAKSPGQQVNVTDQLTQSQAQRALDASGLDGMGITISPMAPGYQDTTPSGYPGFVGMLRDTAVASTDYRYSAFARAGSIVVH